MRIKESWIVALFLFITTLAAVSAVPSLNILEDTVSVSVAPNKDKIVSFNVQNTGTTPITLDFDISQLDLTDSRGEKITLSFSPSAPTLSLNASKKIDVTVSPDAKISFERFGGTLTVKDSTTNSTAKDTVKFTIDIDLDICDFGQVGTALKIDVDEPDNSDEFKPGDVIPIEVEVSNEGQNEIRTQVEAFLFNDNRNIADTSSATKRIDEDEDETFDLRLRVPLESEDFDEDDELTLFIKAFDDEFEELNCVQAKQKVDIQLEDDDIIIDESESRLFPSVAACGDIVSASIRVMNIGDDDNDDVTVSVTNKELRINEKSERFDLESFNSAEENSAIRQFQLKLPADAKPKKYDLSVKVNFDGGSDSLRLPLEVSSCRIQLQFRGATDAVTIKPVEDNFVSQQGKVISLPVVVTNNQFNKGVFAISVANIEDFADASTKTITLNPLSKTTVFLDLVVRESALSGKYSATIFVKEGAKVLASSNVQVQISPKEDSKPSSTNFPLISDIPTSIWIVINVFLLAIVILCIKVVITALKR
tara:strand:+ start:25285 stop:26892 length:1608 start_codon:yes stop_codon:yes gene_type:complete